MPWARYRRDWQTGIFSGAAQAAKRTRCLLLTVVLLYVVSYLVGWYLISVRNPTAVQFAQTIVHSVLTERPFTTVTAALKSGNLGQAILFTFLFNLASGAFLSTTLPGVIPLFGGVVIIGITVLRGFVVGVTYPAVLASSYGALVLGLGTLVLELGAYVFSGAAGIHMALAPIFPGRLGVQDRWAALRAACRDAVRLYAIVVLLLGLGAVWEMTGLFLLIRTR